MIKYGHYAVKIGECECNQKTGYITIAISRPSKEDNDQTHIAGFSFCSPNDHFAKADGRERALLRMINKEGVTVVHNGTLAEVIAKAVDTAFEQKIVPNWLSKARKFGIIGPRIKREVHSLAS
jgi:hypothetical protein